MLERISWLILALLIHLPPFSAFFVPSLISKLYNVVPDDPNFALLQHHKYSLNELDNMIPWEREIYVTLLKNYLEEQEEQSKQRK